MKHRMRIRLNGTRENPFHKLGLKQNPFPQLARAEYTADEAVLNKLEADPIRDEADLRNRLQGFSAEFVDLCVSQFRPGEMVEFEITFNG